MSQIPAIQSAAWPPDVAEGGLALSDYRQVVEMANVGLVVLDLDGGLREANAAFCELTGYPREELLWPGFGLEQLSLPEDVASHAESVGVLARQEEDIYRTQRQIVRRDSGIVWVDWSISLVCDAGGAPHLLVLTTVDITEYKRAEDTLRDMSFYDPLTKLANRRLLQDRLQAVLARAKREKCRVALLFIDLDEFKPINDSLGHAIGDWLLTSVARRMMDCLRDYDTAARFGGDEFVVLLPDLAQPQDALRVAERILTSLAKPFITNDGRQLRISASIGVSLYPEHAETERELLHAGDEAMYAAKKTGRNRIVSAEKTARPGPIAPATEEAPAGLVHLRWEPHHASGNVYIDAEHRELFRQSNQLLDLATRADVRPDAVRSSLHRLIRTVDAHFKHEEKLLAQWQFPGLANHAHKHCRLLEHAEQIATLTHGSTVPTQELLGFLLGEMIHGHILAEDSSYFYLISDSSRG